MTFKKINLFLSGVLVIILFFTLPANNRWLFSKILDSGNDFAMQMNHMDPEDRKLSRYGFSYMIYMNAIKRITVHENAIILLPPNDYLTEVLHVTKFVSPEPAVFYYYTGINAVWANSPDAGRANWEIVVHSDSSIILKKVMNRRHFDSIVGVYKHYIR